MADKGVYYTGDEAGVYYTDTVVPVGTQLAPVDCAGTSGRGQGQESFDIEAYEKENFDEHGFNQKLEHQISTTKDLVSNIKKRIICLFKFSLVVNIIIVVLILALVGLLVYSNFVSATPTVGKGGSTCIYSTMHSGATPFLRGCSRKNIFCPKIFDNFFSFQATEMVLTSKWGRIQPEIQI